MNENNFEAVCALIKSCADGEIGAEEFASGYFTLTEGVFSVLPFLPFEVDVNNKIEEMILALRSDCAQFQPDPKLYAELMETAAYPDEFLDQRGLCQRVLKVALFLVSKGLL